MRINMGVRKIKVENCLTHYGVKGMKWGVRKQYEPHPRQKKLYGVRNSSNSTEKRNSKIKYNSTMSVKTKNGTTISIVEKPTGKFAIFLARHSKKIAEEADRTVDFSIKDVNGKSIGDLELYKESNDSINVVWIGIDKGARGKGYASAVMKSCIQIAKESKCKTVTLEVPGNSPDARHIYEKLGFKEVSKVSDGDDVWGGLTAMRLDLDKINHSDELTDGITERLVVRYLYILKENMDDLESETENQNGSSLTHYGVKGMKWGVRRTLEQLGHRTKKSGARNLKPKSSEDRQNIERLMKKGVKNLSDKELQTILNRLSAEERYKQMTTPAVQKEAKAWVKRTLFATGVIATGIASKALYKKGEDWTRDFMEGFARGWEKAQVVKDVADELRKRKGLSVIHNDRDTPNDFFLTSRIR